MKVLLLGFGNVGRKLAEVLADPVPYPGLRGLHASVVAITTGSHGALANPGGIGLASALEAMGRHGRFTADHPDYSDLPGADAVGALDYDVMVEMTPLDVARRGEPAITHVRVALERGRHVVSCNKGPLAWAGQPLRALARRKGCAFLHESTVMDGAPVFNLARHGLKGNVILGFEGILNSTTNLVLGALERGVGRAEAVAQAQRAGVAEADPRLDLDGWDAAVKVAALANVLMDAELAPEQVERDTLDSVDPAQVRSAPGRGARVRIVAQARREGHLVVGRVKVREVPLADPFALVTGTSSILRIHTDLLGTVSITEESPDLRATAYGVLSDLLSL